MLYVENSYVVAENDGDSKFMIQEASRAFPLEKKDMECVKMEKDRIVFVHEGQVFEAHMANENEGDGSIHYI